MGRPPLNFYVSFEFGEVERCNGPDITLSINGREGNATVDYFEEGLIGCVEVTLGSIGDGLSKAYDIVVGECGACNEMAGLGW